MVGFPLLLIPLAVYNIIVFLMPGVSLADPLLTVTLMSGAEWPITLNDILLALGILLLLLEVIKGARPGAKFVMDHLLSLIVFGAAAAEFVLWPKFGTSTFGLLTLLALADFISGIALRTRRRAVAPATPVQQIEPEPAPPPQPAPAPPPQPAPAPAPQPAPPPAASTTSANTMPPAASVAESVPLDHSKPTQAQPAVASPDLQPSRNPPTEPEQR
ncbi:hypothetical protein AAFX91_37705 [Bradyrhizobium sp. 31Argb]|uniref:hypothetical protein n=1 Tax=unclassified Bradyrhizobium TaxID=2631580 RepID=UPI00102E6EC9|nr:hypothetical protein [Bradyrhizobium sp. Leo170]TAI61258.1 hypothetical protein CWO89_36115 [Bradyrhizobium sp. Leo170]